MRTNRLWGQHREKSLSNTPINLLVGKVHRAYTTAADELFLRGYMSQDSRKSFGSLIGDFLGSMRDAVAAQLPELMTTTVSPDDVDAVAATKATTNPDQLGPVLTALAADVPLTVTKQADGRYRWVLISSNSFQDRDREIISQKALEADVARADATGNYGPLLYWHMDGALDAEGRPTPRVQLGECDYNAMHGRMLIESGTFKSARIAESVKAAAATHGVSIAFRHPESEPDGDGVFQTALRYERSILPIGLASNALTAVIATEKEKTMLKEKFKALSEILGGDEALVNSVIEMAESKEKAALLAGTRTKEAKPPEAEIDPETGKPKTAAKLAEEAAAAAAKTGKSYMGDMELPAFKTLLAETLAPTLESLRAEFTTALSTQTTAKAKADTALAETLKGYEAKIDGVATSVKAALDGVAELKGELPRRLGERLKGFQASAEGEEPGADLKAETAEPHPDGMDKHWKSIQASAGKVVA